MLLTTDRNLRQTPNGPATTPSGPLLRVAYPSPHTGLNKIRANLSDTLTGSVYELSPVDILELATGLITKTLSCPGQFLLTEPFHPSAHPFVTVPITTELCLYLRN